MVTVAVRFVLLPRPPAPRVSLTDIPSSSPRLFNNSLGTTSHKREAGISFWPRGWPLQSTHYWATANTLTFWALPNLAGQTYPSFLCTDIDVPSIQKKAKLIILFVLLYRYTSSWSLGMKCGRQEPIAARWQILARYSAYLKKKSDKMHFFPVAVSGCGNLINSAPNSCLFPKC